MLNNSLKSKHFTANAPIYREHSHLQLHITIYLQNFVILAENFQNQRILRNLHKKYVVISKIVKLPFIKYLVKYLFKKIAFVVIVCKR